MDADFEKTFSMSGFQVFDVLTVLLLGVSISYAYFKFLESEISRITAEQLLLERKDAELRFLKNQINPHFVFNTLNLIYFSIEKQNTIARSLMNSFADLLRYQLYESEKTRISFYEELGFIEKYIHIYTNRMEETLIFKSNIEKPDSDFELPPLILIPFIENALKHTGNAGQEKSTIDLHIRVVGENLLMDIKNSKSKILPIKDPVKGIGIPNVIRRLELLYGKQYEMNIEDSENLYHVKLKLPI